MSLNERKKYLRAEVKRELNLLKDRQQQSEEIVKNVEILLQELSPKVLGLFLPMPDEVAIDSLLNRAGCTKALPRWVDDKLSDGQMDFYSYESEEDLEKQQMFGKEILQVKETRIVTPDVLLVPGLAFSKQRERLGRGKGFYDRYIEKNNKITTIGICFREQLKNNLPLGDHDRLLDILITPDEVYR